MSNTPISPQSPGWNVLTAQAEKEQTTKENVRRAKYELEKNKWETQPGAGTYRIKALGEKRYLTAFLTLDQIALWLDGYPVA